MLAVRLLPHAVGVPVDPQVHVERWLDESVTRTARVGHDDGEVDPSRCPGPCAVRQRIERHAVVAPVTIDELPRRAIGHAVDVHARIATDGVRPGVVLGGYPLKVLLGFAEPLEGTVLVTCAIG